MMRTVWYIVIISTLIQASVCFTIKEETQLRNNIFTNNSYNVNVRPENLVRVTATFNLLTINHLDIKAQTFKVSGWLTLYWRDDRLVWREGEYGNIKFLFATEADVWRPALVVSNSVDNIGVIQDAYAPFRITNNGWIIWDPPSILEVHCEADITYYPFDEQECHIILSSWGYNLREVNITYTGSGINLDEFRPNGEWDLTEINTERKESPDNKGDEYAHVKYRFRMRRKSEYYWLNVLLPVIVNSILTALVFALPAESGEKMGYSLTVLLSFAVLLTLVADKIPSTSINTSLIVVYFSIVLVLGALAVLLSTAVLDIYFTDTDEPIPVWAKKLFKFLGKILCYDGCRKKKIKINKVDVSSPGSENHVNLNLKKSPGTIKSELLNAQDVEKHRRTSWYARCNENELTWKDISRILDIFLLRFYFITITLVTVTFILTAYYHG